MDGYDHTGRLICSLSGCSDCHFSNIGWLELTAYYSQAFKTGVYPTITRDKVVMWARPHPRDAVASADSVSKPTNFELVNYFEDFSVDYAY